MNQLDSQCRWGNRCNSSKKVPGRNQERCSKQGIRFAVSQVGQCASVVLFRMNQVEREKMCEPFVCLLDCLLLVWNVDVAIFGLLLSPATLESILLSSTRYGGTWSIILVARFWIYGECLLVLLSVGSGRWRGGSESTRLSLVWLLVVVFQNISISSFRLFPTWWILH